MELNLDYLEANIDQVGIKEASTLLKEVILSSKDPLKGSFQSIPRHRRSNRRRSPISSHMSRTRIRPAACRRSEGTARSRKA